MNSPKVIANSLYWQEYVAKISKNPKQVERALKAIEKLKAELARQQ